MNIILIGCEFAGKTTLAAEIVEWSKETMGFSSPFHDHFTIPNAELSAEAGASYKAVHPQVKEMFQRFMIYYHLSAGFYSQHDHNLMGAHIEEAVYAPLYYGYGGPNTGSPIRSPEGQRTEMARHMEEEILEKAPNTILVLMKATPEVIRARMFGEPTRGVVRDKDVEHVLARFEEEFETSLIKNKRVLDTTSATLEETMAEFVEGVTPLLSDADRERMAQHKGT